MITVFNWLYNSYKEEKNFSDKIVVNIKLQLSKMYFKNSIVEMLKQKFHLL